MRGLVLPIFLGAYALQLALETALLALNLRRAARDTPVPAELAGALDGTTVARSRAHTLAHGRASLAAGLSGALLTLAVLLGGVLPWLHRTLAGAGLSGAHLFVAFLVALSLGAGMAALPFSIHRTFVIEARFGLNRTTPQLWVHDLLVSLAVEAALGVPLLYALYALLTLTGPAWWLWTFAALTTWQVFSTWLWPALVAPLFNRFTPLPEGELRSRLEGLAREAGFRNRGLYVMDASRRSGRSNAYFTGLFRPRIVLYDTLVERLAVDEVASVLAHEIGHYRRHHLHRRLALALLAELLVLWVASLLLPWPPLYHAFGFPAPVLHAGCALLALCGGAFLFWLAPLAALGSRRHEHEADRYAVRLARAPAALKRALLRLAGDNLANPSPHPWYVAWHYSHPTLPERLARIDAEATGMAG
jgi:STE24 endopeptidase